MRSDRKNREDVNPTTKIAYLASDGISVHRNCGFRSQDAGNERA